MSLIITAEVIAVAGDLIAQEELNTYRGGA
jgi:hypothetical protein